MANTKSGKKARLKSAAVGAELGEAQRKRQATAARGQPAGQVRAPAPGGDTSPFFVCAASPDAACPALAVARPMCVAVAKPGRGAVAGGVAGVQGAELWRPEPGLLVLRKRRRPGAAARVVQHLRRARDARAAPGEAGCGADGLASGSQHLNRQARRIDQRHDHDILPLARYFLL